MCNPAKSTGWRACSWPSSTTCQPPFQRCAAGSTWTRIRSQSTRFSRATRPCVPWSKRFPECECPAASDGFELAVRAVVGQQVSVPGARTLLGRIAATYGELLVDEAAGIRRTFPSSDVLAGAAYEGLGLTKRRAETIRAIAQACATGELVLDGGADREEVRRRLIVMPGIGPWTADYIAMRALGDPDAFLASDLVIRRVVAAHGLEPERWRPWRAYAAMHLWNRTTTFTNESRELSWSA